MNILRKINTSFAVPNWQNASSIIRLFCITIASILYFPLISHYQGSYWDEVIFQANWALPLILTIVIKDLIITLTTKLYESSFAPFWALLTHAIVFCILELGVMPNHEYLEQRAALFFLFIVSIMYFEAARRNLLVPALSEARLTALTARIRPHFLFNSLNAAISLIRLRPYDAETLLENLANLFRAQLRDGSQSSTLGQEIEWAQEYIAIEQIRMGHTRVQVMWQHQAPDDAETPHLLLQPLLENAVFHGVESTHRPGMISVLTKLHKSSIFIRIENPYVPPEQNASLKLKPHKSNSMAMKNLKERLALIYDNDAKVQTHELDGIFRVDIRIPYRKKNADDNRLFG